MKNKNFGTGRQAILSTRAYTASKRHYYFVHEDIFRSKKTLLQQTPKRQGTMRTIFASLLPFVVASTASVPLSTPMFCNTLIVGGGISGLYAANEMAMKGKKDRVGGLEGS